MVVLRVDCDRWRRVALRPCNQGPPEGSALQQRRVQHLAVDGLPLQRDRAGVAVLGQEAEARPTCEERNWHTLV